MNHEEKRKEIDLIEYWKVILKRKWVIVTFAGTLIFFTAVFSFLATPLYKAKAVLLLEGGQSRVLNIEETLGYRPSAERDYMFFNTQLKLLESRSLSERVAKKMNLLSRWRVGSEKEQKKSLVASIKSLLTFKWLRSKKGANNEDPNPLYPPNPYSGVASALQKGIGIRLIRDTKLVEVNFTSPQPVFAAEAANTWAQEFISFSIEKRYQFTQQASDFLSAQIANLRDDLAEKEKELLRYGKEKDLLFLRGEESAAVNKFSDLTHAYTQAQIARINAEAEYRELREIEIDSLQSIKNPVIQQLKRDYTNAKNEYEEKSKLYKPDYPEMLQLRARMDSIREEIKNAVDSAESEYRAALKKENSLKRELERQKENVAMMNSSAILYNNLKIEVENKRSLLNSLVERQNETLVSEQLGGLKSSNISIIDEAEVPKSPVSPKKKMNLILAFFFGILGGLGLCFLLEYLDNRVKGPEEIEKLSGLPSLGVIPLLSHDRNKKAGYNAFLGYRYSNAIGNPQSGEDIPQIKEIELINHLYPKLSVSEDYRTVRTSILLSHSETPPKTMVFTSAMPVEGKTATVVNMAVSFAQLEHKVLVIDSDLRKPRLHKIFKTRNVGGLSGFLSGKKTLNDAIQKTSIENIWILPSGPIPPNPAELLNSKKMKEMLEEVKQEYDVILIDTPPVLAVIDALIVTSYADSTILIVNSGKLTKKPFLNAVEELKRAKANVIGAVVNGLDVKKGDYFYMDYYRYHPYRYYGEEETQVTSE